MVVRTLTGSSNDEPASPLGAANYERHYGFRESPFTLTANPRFIFDSRAYVGVLETILRAVQRREPLVVITGPPGSGKTLLCRAVTAWRNDRTFIALIPAPPASAKELLQLVLDQFGVLPRDSRRSAEASDLELAWALEQFAGSLGWFGARAVILVDDAHRLSKEVFEGLRSLINFETDTEKLLQIVLLGEPALAGMLSDPEFTQLNQRVTRRCVLGPLLPEEVAGYIEHRLSVAQNGCGAVATVFSPEAIAAIRTLSLRVPRVINLLCDRSLEAAHALGLSPVSLAVVIEAAQSLDLPVPLNLRMKRQWPTLVAATVSLVVGSALGYGMYMYARGPRPESPPPSQSQAAVSRQLETGVVNASSASAVANPMPTIPPEPVAAPSELVAPPPAASVPPPGAGPLVPKLQDSASAPQPSVGSAGFIVVAGSFRNEWRGSALSDRVSSELGLPVRVRAASGWHQVVIGPYATREEAEGARERLRGVDVVEALVVAVPSAPVPAVRARVATPPAATDKPSPQESGSVVATTGAKPSAQGRTNLLDRARGLAQAADVRALLRLRESAESQLTREGREAADVRKRVQELDELIEDARRRRLELDAKAFDTLR